MVGLARPGARLFPLALGLALALLGIVTGVDTGFAARPKKTEPESVRVWPPPPDEPRITYVSSIGKPADVGARIGGFSRFANWITGGTKGNEPLVKPFGVALDENDNLCVTDTGSPAICYYNRAKKTWSRWSRLGTVTLASPVGVAKRGSIIYVADSALGAVVALDEKGKLRFTCTNDLQRPVGLAIVKDQLWAIDSMRHCIVRFDLEGRHLSDIGTRGSREGQFNFPTHICADRLGKVYVTDSMNSRVQILDSEGRYQASIGSAGDGRGHFSRPKGVALDSMGNIYVVDALFDNLQIFDGLGRLLLSLGEPGSGPGQFWLPNGIAIDRQNQIFVADSYNRRVQVLKYIGQQ